MEKTKNSKRKILIPLLITGFLLCSFLLYFVVSANEDEYKDKIIVKNTNVTVLDGSAPFDNNSEPGNDENSTNHIVRSFDSIQYSIDYKLDFKSDVENKDTNITRNVLLEVLLPSQVNANVTIGGTGGSDDGLVGSKVTIDNVQYNFYTTIISTINLSNDSNNILLNVSNINLKNGDTILPIINIKEETESTPSLKDATSLNDITNILSEDDRVTVSAKNNIKVKLYPGTKINNKNTGVTTLPVGVVIYVPNQRTFDGNKKGILGSQVPTNVNYNLNIKYLEGSGTIAYKDYNLNPSDNYIVKNLPISYNDNTVEAANINTTEGYQKTYELNFKNIQYNLGYFNLNVDTDEEENVFYVSSVIVGIDSTKDGKNDAKLLFNIDDSSTIIVDNYESYVGDYSSKIDFISEKNITVIGNKDITFEKSGEAMFNYGENVYIQNTMAYGLQEGDELVNGFTNYIKLDSDFLSLSDVGNIGDSTLSYYAEIDSTNKNQITDINVNQNLYDVQYGFGTWDASNFMLNDNAPGYCPKSVLGLSKEDLMNYYGGPCIKEKSNAIEWSDDLSLTNDENGKKVILVKFNFNDTFYNGTTAILRLKAKVKSNDLKNINKTTAVVSRGTTISDGNLYYLSKIPNKSVSIQDSDIKYIKTLYDGSHNIIEGTNVPNNDIGNTLIVSPFKAYISRIAVKDSNDSSKTEIFSGITDPVTITITPALLKSTSDSTFKSATITVYLPKNLQLANETKDKKPTISINDALNDNYTAYTYSYTEDDIKYGDNPGEIDPLVIHAYIDISTIDYTSVNLIAEINAVLKPNDDATTTFESIQNLESKQGNINLLLRNNREINLQGKLKTNTNIEKNGEIIYNMRATNISGESEKLSLLKLLPYNNDGIKDGSTYSGYISTKINTTIPSDYELYYTKVNPKTIVNNENNSVDKNNWVKWSDYTKYVSGITAIKIVSTKELPNGSYFVSKAGIDLSIKTSNNIEGDTYYNNFYMIQNGKKNCIVGDDDCTEDHSGITLYVSNISTSSVYNRSISGYVFEDYDYSGLYSNDEKRLSDIAIEVYKVANDEIESKNFDRTIDYMTKDDKLVAETITNKDGEYSVKGLERGLYYVKYTFDCEKYTVTQKNKVDETLGVTSDIDSDSEMVKDTCTAVSNIVKLDNDKIDASYINLGLRIRQNFEVELKKYITTVVVNSNRGSQTYNYDKADKVKIDVKNLKNTSFRVTYKFEIKNTKYFPGTIGKIVETIPEGMTFDPSLAENKGWYQNGDKVYYTNLNKTFIFPDEKYYMTIVFDLKTDNGGTYVNFISASDFEIMDMTTNLLEGVKIANYDPTLDEDELDADGSDEDME